MFTTFFNNVKYNFLFKNIILLLLGIYIPIGHSTMKALLNNVNNSCNLKTLFLIIQSLEMTVLDFFYSPLFEDLYNINLD